MNIYEGKHLDFFEDAINMLLIANNYTEIEDIDCISLRNTSFVNEVEIKNWFKPKINTYDGLKNIEQTICSDGLFSIRKITVRDFNFDRILVEKSPFVLGPISKRCLLHKIDTNYYDGDRNYIYCFFYDGRLVIHEPDGVPFLIVNDRDFLKMFEKREYLLMIQANPNLEINIPNKKILLKKWLEKKKLSKMQEYDISNFDYTVLENINNANEISFRFAIENYMIQISKIYRFIKRNAVVYQNQDIINDYFEYINDILYSKQYSMINTIINNIDKFLISCVLEELR